MQSGPMKKTHKERTKNAQIYEGVAKIQVSDYFYSNICIKNCSAADDFFSTISVLLLNQHEKKYFINKTYLLIIPVRIILLETKNTAFFVVFKVLKSLKLSFGNPPL